MAKEKMMKILITGTAGFIGFHLVNKLISENEVIGIDNVNNYYDVELKYARLRETGINSVQNSELRNHPPQRTQKTWNSELKVDKKINSTENKEEINFIKSEKYENYRFVKMDLLDKEKLIRLFKNERFDYVIHLAAQAGVRYSITNPQAYIDSNVIGFFNVLEACSLYTPKHLIFASSSSVYGENTNTPFSTKHNTDHPVSLYAATKKSNEVIAHSYSVIYGISITGLRFFTVYGPWGRPDMAYFSFTKNIIEGNELNVFNNGNLYRDFTYIDDIIDGIIKLIDKTPNKSENEFAANYKLYNIGNNSPVKLNKFIEILEETIGKDANKKYVEHQLGDVFTTYADIDDLRKLIGFEPKTKLEEGLRLFYEWYKKYYII